jgi:hypothetical protein
MKIKILITTLFLLAVFASGRVYAACIEDPIGYWTLDQNTSPYNNETRDNYHGTCTAPGCPVVDTSGQVGSSQIFDGADDGILIADSGTAIFDRGTTDSFSIAVWFRRDAGVAWAGNEVLVGRYVNVGANRAHFWVGLADSTGYATFRLWDNVNFNQAQAGIVRGNINLADGQWHQMVAVRNGQTNQNFLYVDGVEIGVVPITYTGDFIADAPMTIGRQNNNYYFNGNIDEAAFFDVALSADIVGEMFDAGNVGRSICTDNMPPTITSQAPTEATVGVEYVYNPEAEDPDGDTLTWSLVNQPTDMNIDTSTGAITWTPPAGTTTSDLITLVVDDGFQGTDSQDFTITVGDGTNPDPNPNSDGDSSSGGGCFISTIIH